MKNTLWCLALTGALACASAQAQSDKYPERPVRIVLSYSVGSGPDAVARMLGEQHDVEMVELHHSRKKDSPSGTALKLAECLAEAKGWNLPEVACYHREGIIGERPHKEIGLQTLRGGDVVGGHTVYFMGPGERIEVTHQAHSRENFAGGALRAARWLAGQKPGKLYSMRDVLG